MVWLIFALAVQGLAAAVLGACGVFLLLVGAAVRQRWWRLALRAKWLLLSLWLILAYGTPGELLQGMDLAPTLEGLELASVHAARILILIGSLAWLFEILPQQRFLAALWSLAKPLAVIGLQAERTVVRLALVFEYVQSAPPRGSWRHFLEPASVDADASATITIEVQTWHWRDSAFLLFGSLLMLLLWWLS